MNFCYNLNHILQLYYKPYIVNMIVMHDPVFNQILLSHNLQCQCKLFNLIIIVTYNPESKHLNIGHSVELTFLEGKLGNFLLLIIAVVKSNFLTLLHFESEGENRFNCSQLLKRLSQEIHPDCPQRGSILHNGLHLYKLESICKPANLFL